MTTYSATTHGAVDIIFAGGGTAACVAAGRLARTNPDLKILLIEGGRSNYQDPAVLTPALARSHLAPNSQTALFYKSRSTEHLAGRELVVAMGGLLGGGSSINLMMYTRAQGIDYDSWKMPGWTAKDMIPLCKKLETFHQDEDDIDRSKHGYDGPIHVSDGGFTAMSTKVHLETVKKIGYSEVVDLQDFEQIGGFTRCQRYVSPDGNRQDAAHCYIHPLLQDGRHPNLHLLLECKVIRVIFDNKSTPPHAIGVEYVPSPTCQLVTSVTQSQPETIMARKLVVVSAGALGTPQILERSGVGNPVILNKLGIPVVSDLPGVGENYQDHQLSSYPYKTSLNDGETLDCIYSGGLDVEKARVDKNPILGWNGVDLSAKLRIPESEVASLGQEFQAEWKRDFGSSSRHDIICCFINGFAGDPSLVDPGNYITMSVFTAYPYSRGKIHITSRSDVLNGYEFDTGFLSHQSDLKKQLWGYKVSREIFRRMPFYKGEVELGHPKFRARSKAALVTAGDLQTGTPNLEVANIQYDEQDDTAIENWIRANLKSTWHSMGTCAMRPRKEGKGGVVDGDLNVYGTVGLKVVDMSIAPQNVGANTYNTALAIGENAALIIGRELGLEV